MVKKKNKFLIISIILSVLLIVFAAIVYAMLASKDEVTNRFRIASLDIEIVDLALKDDESDDIEKMEPGQIGTISWTSENVGSTTALTRHTMSIYLDVDQDLIEGNALYLYPADMSDDEILADFEGKKEKVLETTSITKDVESKTIYGIQYKFPGDTLKGTDPSDVTDKTSEDISFKLLLIPNLSYLCQDKDITIDVVTEAVQYGEDADANWQAVDNENI